MPSSAFRNASRFIFAEVIGDVFYAPVWWYGRGFLKLLEALRGRLLRFERSLGLRLWITTLGKPMYGQYDLAGKIISFFMRLSVLFGRVIVFLGYSLLLAIAALLWSFTPIFIVWQIVLQFGGLLQA